MAGFGVFTQFMFLPFAAFLLASDSNQIKAPQSHRAAGVFILIEGGEYTFNFTAARAACLFLNVTIATTAQMERALQHGLQTCKFGWTAEQVAAIPRLTADKNCGQGKTGVVKWLASSDKKFGVYCFNASDVAEIPNTPAASSSVSTTPTAPTQTPAPATPLHRSTAGSEPSAEPRTTKAPIQTTFTLPVRTTRSPGIPSTSTPPKPPTTRSPTTPSHLITLKPAGASFAFSTSVHAPNYSTSSQSAVPPSVSSVKPSLGDVPTALIILGTVLLLLTAAGVVWYYKLNVFAFWPQGQQKDDIEAEMWKHTDSEMDLRSQHEGEEEEEEDSDRKYSSDFMLCVNPDMRTNFLE